MALVKSEKELKISFLSKEPLNCPICDTSFHREELLSGGGRMIAGPLTDELHRKYEPSSKYGPVYPLAYQPTVCPACWFASWDVDFVHVPFDKREEIRDDREQRIHDLQTIFPVVDFGDSRSIKEGAAAHYLALRCYQFYTPDFSPTIKQGITALRCGWLFDELHELEPSEHYDWLALLCKKKALFLYKESVELEQSGKESLSGLRNYGPDIDKNYGYEGALYLTALLEKKYGNTEHQEERIQRLGECKRTIAKIFGLGKSSKAKPGPLLEKARNLYDEINEELHEEDD